jgi:hypothetical protein
VGFRNGDREIFRAGNADLLPRQRGPKNHPVPVALSPEEFERFFSTVDTSAAIYGFTLEADTHAILMLLVHCQAKRILEIGTAAGHMTANFTQWSPDDAVVFSMGIVDDMRVPNAICTWLPGNSTIDHQMLPPVVAIRQV